MDRYTLEDVKALVKRQDEVVITAEEYLSLLEDARMLQCLQNAGVDNWDGHSYAMEEFYGEEED